MQPPLEPLLRWLRTRKVQPFVEGRNVLDFGCGGGGKSLCLLSRRVRYGVGVDRLLGHDSVIQPLPNIFLTGSFSRAREIQRENGFEVDVVISLATFEHLYEDELVEVLRQLRCCTRSQAIWGTMPTPAAQPVLEVLALRLHLLDEAQILDHKLYYTPHRLARVVEQAGWRLAGYRTFQLGFNGLFELQRG